MSKNCEKNACANYIKYLDKINDKMNNEMRIELDKVKSQLKSKKLSINEINKLKDQEKFLQILPKKNKTINKSRKKYVKNYIVIKDAKIQYTNQEVS